MDTKNNEVVREEVARLILAYCKVVNTYFDKVVRFAKTQEIPNKLVFIKGTKGQESFTMQKSRADILANVSRMNIEITKLSDLAKSINWNSVTLRDFGVLVWRVQITSKAVREVELIWNADAFYPSYDFVRNATDKMLLVLETEEYRIMNGGE